jgi:hypothetical protein
MPFVSFLSENSNLGALFVQDPDRYRALNGVWQEHHDGAIGARPR